MTKTKVLYQKATVQWGYEAQIQMAQEECIELAHAIMKFTRARGSSIERIYQIEEEIADVEIMMAQLRLIFNEDRIKKVKKKKLKRLERRLRGE